jgi:LDH2 family malate/lactate/ureidoglycolate dehydrogenase
MTEDAQRFAARALEEFAAAVLAALGLPAADALVTAQAIVRADLEGVETHGLRRLPNYVARLQRGLINPRPQMTFARRRGGTAVLDADNGPGQVAAARAMVEAIRLAGEYGTGWVAVRQSNHFGAAAYYANLAAEVGMIGVALSNSPPGVAPWGGRQAFLGTNPIGVGMPGGLGLDLATSGVARGQVLKAARTGTRLPPDVAIDADGLPTDDPLAALQGALLPVGGAKGFALALAVEAFCGVLAGANLSPEIPSYFDDWEHPSGTGHFIGALDVAAFAEPADFLGGVERLVAGLKAVPPAAGHDGVRVPGERRARRRQERAEHGVPLAPATVAALVGLARDLGVALPAPVEG